MKNGILFLFSVLLIIGCSKHQLPAQNIIESIPSLSPKDNSQNLQVSPSPSLQEKKTDITNIGLLFQNEIPIGQDDIVYRYAPIIFQATNKKKKPEYWDFITSVDFDGDLVGNNNEQSLVSNKTKLPATVYYDFLETKTHYFITYSSFHPLDWSTGSSIIPYTWHENDMENIQVVVRKKTSSSEEKVVLLSTQAHLDTAVLTGNNTGITSAGKKLEKSNFRLLSDDVVNEGTHSGVFVETGGHGIHSMTLQEGEFQQLNPPKLKEGFTFIPSFFNIPENYESGKQAYFYQLKSIYSNFWIHYTNHQNIGNGKLMDGTFDYKDELVDYKEIPRHFDSNRFSGPNKYDAGILPFAFSYSLTSKDLGVIFFNPAKKYKETLNMRDEWSNEYIYNPYLPSNYFANK